MNDNYLCALCLSDEEIQRHHSVFKSQVRALSHCKLNYTYLCKKCHRELHKHKNGELDKKVKLMFQSKIEQRFLKKYIDFKEIKETLEISNSATKKLVCGMNRYKEGYKREELIKRCMGSL